MSSMLYYWYHSVKGWVLYPWRGSYVLLHQNYNLGSNFTLQFCCEGLQLQRTLDYETDYLDLFWEGFRMEFSTEIVSALLVDDLDGIVMEVMVSLSYFWYSWPQYPSVLAAGIGNWGQWFMVVLILPSWPVSNSSDKVHRGVALFFV